MIRERGVMSFHAVGCSGDFKEHLPGLAVAKAMAGQIGSPHADGGNPVAVGASFLFHLGDVVYKDEDPSDPEGKDQAALAHLQTILEQDPHLAGAKKGLVQNVVPGLWGQVVNLPGVTRAS